MRVGGCVGPWWLATYRDNINQYYYYIRLTAFFLGQPG